MKVERNSERKMERRKMIGLALILCALSIVIINQDFSVGFLGLSSDFWTGFVLSASITMLGFLVFYKFIIRKHRSHELSAKWGKSTSIGDGYWFFFEHQGDEIVLHRSTYMGIETVYLNDNPVSRKHNFWGLKKSHELMHKGKNIQVVTDFVNIIGYRYECSLYIDLTKYHTETKGLVVANAKDFAKSALISLSMGLAGGLISGGAAYLIFRLFE
jgi:hypothetical protein